MSVIAKVVVPATALLSDGVLATDGGTVAQLERVVADDEQPIPYFWVKGAERSALIDTFKHQTDAAEVVVVDELDTQSLVKVSLPPDKDTMFHLLVETGADVLEATIDERSWTLQLAFGNHEEFVEFYRWCVDHEIDIEVDGVRDPTGSGTPGFEFALTSTQRETLLTAFRRGYFDVPRGVNLIGLAEEFDISDTAVSQRLRRGVATLIAATIVESEETVDD